MKKAVINIISALALMLALSVSSGAESLPHVLFDQAHGQKFVIEEGGELHLSVLAGVVRQSGATATSSRAPLTDELLRGVAGLVISGPFQLLSADEADAAVRFLERGGRLAVMLHIGSPLAPLLERLDVDFSNAVLHERRNLLDQDLNFKVTDLSGEALFAGVPEFSLYGGWALNPGPSVTSMARTSPEAWVDLDGTRTLSRGDALGPFTVVAGGKRGSGAFVVFGDDAIFQNRYLDGGNRQLALNLAAWLSGKQP